MFSIVIADIPHVQFPAYDLIEEEKTLSLFSLRKNRRLAGVIIPTKQAKNKQETHPFISGAGHAPSHPSLSATLHAAGGRLSQYRRRPRLPWLLPCTLYGLTHRVTRVLAVLVSETRVAMSS